MSKKIRATIYIVGVLWIAVMSQLLVNRLFVDDGKIMDAFEDTDSNIEESKLNIVVEYGDGFILNNEKVDVLNKLADSAGIKDYEIKTENIENARNTKIEKKTEEKDSTIEFISLTQDAGKKTEYHHFILLELNMNKNFKGIIEYKKKLEHCVNSLKPKDYQSVLKFTGTYPGLMTVEKRNENIKTLLDNLNAKTIDRIESDDYYALYAYTSLVDDYITVGGKKMNINVTVTYNEKSDKTEICLATPVLNEEF